MSTYPFICNKCEKNYELTLIEMQASPPLAEVCKECLIEIENQISQVKLNDPSNPTDHPGILEATNKEETMNDKYAYSIDEEYYEGEYDTANAAAAEGFSCYEDADVVSVGRIVRPDVKSFVYADNILEVIAEDICEHHGDYLNGWCDDMVTPSEKHNELQTIIADWIEKNYPIEFFSVDDVVKFTREWYEEEK